ncbi:uncharacterized protein LOC143285219 [Babylonia areolata]|uniref:uncharacterized protein LOC143285219 n=1 Tax=Babylonia areolata TaxID=304850 RepID=UPI003FD2BE53
MKSSKVPQNFVSMADRLRCEDADTTDSARTEDTELWLVQVPQGFDVSALSKLDMGVLGVSGGTQTLKVKAEQEEKKLYYSVAAFRDSADCKKMSTVVSSANGDISLGGDVQNMLVVTETAAHSAWHVDSALLAPKKPVPMPTGLRVRYTPFGAGTPCPSISGKSKKRKKSVSKGEEADDKGVSDEFQKSSKKRKREASPDECGEPSPKKKKRKSKDRHSESMELQNEDVPDGCDEPSPMKKKKKSKDRHSESMELQNEDGLDGCDEPSPMKKKKKSKDRHSKSMELHNGDGEITEGDTVSRTHKHKRRKSEGTALNSSSAGEDSFVIDGTAGDLGLKNVTDTNKKHKKSKKNKEHRTV